MPHHTYVSPVMKSGISSIAHAYPLALAGVAFMVQILIDPGLEVTACTR